MFSRRYLRLLSDAGCAGAAGAALSGLEPQASVTRMTGTRRHERSRDENVALIMVLVDCINWKSTANNEL
jgi:hypothetical protein